MKVWIIERDHDPMVIADRVPAYPTDEKGTAAMKFLLNRFPTDQEHHYYDAVLYERIEPDHKELQNLESGE